MADAASRILSGKKVKSFGGALQDTLKHQRDFARHQKNFVAALKRSSKQTEELTENQVNLGEALKEGNQETKIATKNASLLGRAYSDIVGTVKKYGAEISASAASLQILRLEQRATTRGLQHFYKAADKIPTKLNKTGDVFENIGKTGSQALSSVGNSLGHLVSGDLKKAYKEVNTMVSGGEGSLMDTFLGTEGALGAVNASRKLAKAIGKDAHFMAQRYNVPQEAVRGLQDQIMDTMRSSTTDTKGYSKELKTVTDRMLFAKKVIPGLEEGEMVQFLNRSMWEFGSSSETAARRISDLSQYVEVSNAALQKQGKLAKGATAQWKDDYAKAVMEASMSSKSLFLNTEKLSSSMMAAAHSAHKMGLSYNQAQRVMKGIPMTLEGVPDFMKDKIGGSFLDVINDAEKYKAYLETIDDEEQRGYMEATIKNIQASEADPYLQRKAIYDVVSGTEKGQQMALEGMLKVGGARANPALMSQMTGMSVVDAINFKAAMESGGVEEFMAEMKKKKGADGTGFDDAIKAQTEGGLSILTGLEDVMGKVLTYTKELSENVTLLTAIAGGGGGTSAFNYLTGRSGGGGVAASLLGGGGVAAALTGGGGGAAAGGAAAGGGGVMASLGGMLSSQLGTGMTMLTVAKLLGMGGGGGLLSRGVGLAARGAGALGRGAAGGAAAAVPLAVVGISAQVAKHMEGVDKSFLEMHREMSKASENIKRNMEDGATILKGSHKGISDELTETTQKKLKADAGWWEKWVSSMLDLSGKRISTDLVSFKGGGGGAGLKAYTKTVGTMMEKVSEGELEGMNAKQLSEYRMGGATGRSPIAYMFGRPSLAADMFQALQAKGASPEAIQGAIKIFGARQKNSLKSVQSVLQQATGATVAERKKQQVAQESKKAVDAADKMLKDRDKKAKISSAKVAPKGTIGVLSKLHGPKEVTINPNSLKESINKESKINPSAIRQLQNQAAGVSQTVGGARRPRPQNTGDIPLKAGVDNMGKLTLTLDSFYDLISDYEAAKDSKLPYGTGVPR